MKLHPELLAVALLFLLVLLACPKPNGETYWQAACDGNLEVVKGELHLGVAVDYQGKAGYTALSCAAKFDRLDVASLLLGLDADINASDNNRDKTPLMQASFQDHADMVEFLLPHHPDLNHQAVNKWTALHDAAYIGNLPIVRDLVTAGASLTLLNERNETPLGTAQRALSDCQKKSPDCPITRGDTTHTVADLAAVVKYLTGKVQP